MSWSKQQRNKFRATLARKQHEKAARHEAYLHKRALAREAKRIALRVGPTVGEVHASRQGKSKSYPFKMARAKPADIRGFGVPKGGVVMLDEFKAATPETQAAAAKAILHPVTELEIARRQRDRAITRLVSARHILKMIIANIEGANEYNIPAIMAMSLKGLVVDMEIED